MDTSQSSSGINDSNNTLLISPTDEHSDLHLLPPQTATLAVPGDLESKMAALEERLLVVERERDEALNALSCVERDKEEAFMANLLLEKEKDEVFNALVCVEREKEEALKANAELRNRIQEVVSERDSIRVEINGIMGSLEEKEHDLGNKILELQTEVHGLRTILDKSENEKRDRTRVITECSGLAQMEKDGLMRIIECLDQEKVEISGGIENEEGVDGEFEFDQELSSFIKELKGVSKLVSAAESKVSQVQEMRKKEKELENSVVSLTEENRDIYSLLRIALVEKEAVEKSLNKLKGNNEQKRVPLLHFAERGLQRVGFGFMMGGAVTDQSLDNASVVSIASAKSDGSECEDEVNSLASTVEKIMKNLRLEITQLRRSLEDSRSDTERLQSLNENQAQTITENTLYIKELEDRERMMTQSVEELLIELKETEEEVARWREACELEVEAGKSMVKERDKLTAILQQELEKTKAALQISNSKLQLKEDLAATAMAAQAAAERSLNLADSRAAGLCERIEELTRQLEEPERREKSRRKVRHICWPWKVLNNTRFQNQRRMMLPEMQALLR